MEARIEVLPEKKVVGKSMRMSVTNTKTFELWNSFMISKGIIKNTVGTDLYSMQLYDNLSYFQKFDPNTEFTKWAAIEVEDHINIPNGFSPYTLKNGLYAVFIHKGPPSGFPKTTQFIFGEWLPNSDYELDDRPHFELLGETYKNNDPSSEEEVWIPIRRKEVL